MTAKEKLSFLIRCGLRFSSDESRIMDIIREEVNKTPTTSEKKTSIERSPGEWIWDGYTSLYCSACKEHIYCSEDPDIPAETRFCPNCGAKMKRH